MIEDDDLPWDSHALKAALRASQDYSCPDEVPETMRRADYVGFICKAYHEALLGEGRQFDRIFLNGGEYIRADEAARKIIDLQSMAGPLAKRMHDRHDWAQPGDAFGRSYVLRFCDQDMREMYWEGPAGEEEALAAWEKYSPAWNVTLFAAVRQAPRSVAITPLDEARADMAKKAVRDGNHKWAEEIKAGDWDGRLMDILEGKDE